ncbi:hypothetical protein F4810DRAFT_269789 [Camillea tinctor]|nr:hypothetical protein F4810DRAFT_269789 [Camillea tinctor]
MARRKTFFRILPLQGYWYIYNKSNPQLLKDEKDNAKMKAALIRDLPKVNWATVDPRICELFETCLDYSHIIDSTGWETFWLNVFLAVSWTKNDSDVNERMLEEFAGRVAEARARGCEPANFAHSLSINRYDSNSLVIVDRWIDFLATSVPEHAISSAVPDLKQLAAEEKKENEEILEKAVRSRKRALEDDQEAMQAKKKLRVTRQKMEDLDIEERGLPEQEGMRRFAKKRDLERRLDRVVATAKYPASLAK